jgi:hypothetical protein
MHKGQSKKEVFMSNNKLRWFPYCLAAVFVLVIFLIMKYGIFFTEPIRIVFALSIYAMVNLLIIYIILTIMKKNNTVTLKQYISYLLIVVAGIIIIDNTLFTLYKISMDRAHCVTESHLLVYTLFLFILNTFLNFAISKKICNRSQFFDN